MKFRRYRLMAADGVQTSTGAPVTTLITDGAQTTPAASSNAPADATATPAAAADATQQPSTDKAPAKADGAEAPPAKVVPDSYTFTAPEGQTLDAEAVAEFSGIAKEFGLSQEEGQKVADIGAKLAQRWETKQAETLQTASAEWAAAATADKEYGGDKLEASMTAAKKALTAFGSPELTTLLNGSGLGNHPEVIRFMVRAGKAVSEDRMVTGGTGPAGNATESAAQRMYPSMNP